jgi:hypothetical protein
MATDVAARPFTKAATGGSVITRLANAREEKAAKLEKSARSQ